MYKIFKRTFDFLSSLILFIIILPLFLIIFFLVLINMGFPVFFKQERSGKNQKSFTLLKFRTMKNTKDKDGQLLPDAERMTGFGSFLRSSSLDELPELLNIVIGNMSVIGPRPLPVSYDRYYKDSELKRFEVLPGLLPPDSLSSEAFITWDEQLDYESNYGERCSFVLDMKILIKTFKMLFIRSKNDYGEYVRKPLSEERNNGIQ